MSNRVEEGGKIRQVTCTAATKTGACTGARVVILVKAFVDAPAEMRREKDEGGRVQRARE